MAKFTIEAGIVFKPNDASRASIKKTLNASVANFEIQIAKARMTKNAQEALINQLSKRVFKIGKAQFLPSAFTKLVSQFSKRAFKVGKADFSGGARKSLQTSFSAIPFTIENLKLGAGAVAKLQQTVSKTPVQRGQRRQQQTGRDPIRNIADQARRLTQVRAEIEQSARSALAGVSQQGQLDNLSKAQQRAAIQANTLRRNISQIGPAASVGIRQSVTQLSNLRRSFGDLGIITNRASLAQNLFTGQQARFAGAQRGVISSIGNVNSQVSKLTQTQSNFGKIQSQVTSGVTAQTSRLNAVQQVFANGQGVVSKGVGQTANSLLRVRGEVEKASRSFGSAIRGSKDLGSTFQQSGTSAEVFGSRLVEVTGRFAAYALALRVVLGVQQAFSASLRTIVEFDSVLQDLQKVINETPQGLNNLSEGIFDAARATGRGIDEVATSLNTFVRQGLDVNEALARTQSALIATNISELNVEESTKLLTSALKIFGDELETDIQILDVLSITADNAATNAAEVGRAFIRSASAAELTGVSFKQLTAFITATIDRTQEAGSRVGTALKTIFTRLQTNSKILRENANALGSNIKSNDTLAVVIGKLNVLFGTLDETQKTQLATLVAGRRQVNIFAGLIESFGKSQELLAKQSEAAGTALDKQRRDIAKLSTQVQILKDDFQELVVELSGVDEGADGLTGIRGALSDIVRFTAFAVSSATDLAKAVKEVEVLGLNLGTVFSAVSKTAFFVGGAAVIRAVGRGIFAALGAVRGITTQLATTNKTMQALTLSTQAVKTNEQLTLGIEKQRENVLKRILNLTRAAAGQQVQVGGVGRQSGGNVSRGALAAATTALVVSLQLAETSIRETADGLRDSGDAANNFSAAVLDASGSALNLGATLGLITGRIGVGLIAAAAAAANSFIRFSIAARDNAQTIRGVVIDEARARLTGAQALKSGNQALINVFKDAAANTGQAIEDVVLQQSLALQRAFGTVGGALQRSANTIDRVGDALDDIESSIQRTGQLFRLQRSQRQSTNSFRTREITAQIGAEGGALGERFREIDRIISETRVAAESVVGPLESSSQAADVLGRSMEFVLSKTQDASLQTGQLLKELQLQSPELDKLNESFAEQTRLSQQVRDEVSASRTELEQLGAEEFQIRINREDFEAANKELDRAERSLKRQVEAQDEVNSGLRRVPKIFVNIERARQRLENAQRKVNEVDKETVVTIKQLSEQLNEAGGSTENLLPATQAVVDANKNILETVKLYEASLENINSLTKSEAQATSNLSDIAEQRSRAESEVAKQVEKVVESRLKLIALAQAQAQEVQLRSTILRQEISDLQGQLDFERQLERARSDGTSSAIELNEITIRGNRSISERIRLQERSNALTIDRLRSESQELRGTGRPEAIERADQLDQAATALQRALQEQLPLIKAEIEAKVKIDIERELLRFVEGQEKSLSDFRINEIRRVVSEQEKATDNQIATLQRFGDSALGERVFGGLLRSIGDPVANVFGRTASAVLRLQEQQLERFADSVAQEFNELESQGVGNIERLQNAQRLQNELLERSRQQVENRRQVALDRARDAAERVERAERDLIEARNQLPAANQRLIEASRELASANTAVTDANRQLLTAFGQASDAQAELRFQIQLANFQAKQQLGSFGSLAQQFQELGNIFRSTTEEITASERVRLQLARQIAQTQLNLLQQQFQAVQTIGQQAATATGEGLLELQQAIGAASAIQAGTANVGTFTPELLQAISSLPDALFPGLQRTISEFGLERLGIDPSVFQSLEDDILDLTRITAETNQEAVIAANEQIRLAQQQIIETQNNKSFIQSQLAVAQESKAALLQNVNVARFNLATSQAGFTTQIRNTAQVISRLDGQIAATRRVGDTLNTIADILRNQTAAIQASATTGRFQSTGGSTNIDQQLQNLTNELSGIGGNIANNLQNLFGVSNAAGGNVTSGELAGLASAARREKRGMPPGSNLMLANTSEVVLTRRQAKTAGLRAVPKANAVDGNAAGDATSLSNIANTLNQTMNALLTRINSPGFIEQNVNVNVDTQRTLNVRGVEAFDSTVRSILQERFGVMAQQDELDAVVQSLGALVLNLNEQGIVSARGT